MSSGLFENKRYLQTICLQIITGQLPGQLAFVFF